MAPGDWQVPPATSANTKPKAALNPWLVSAPMITIDHSISTIPCRISSIFYHKMRFLKFNRMRLNYKHKNKKIIIILLKLGKLLWIVVIGFGSPLTELLGSNPDIRVTNRIQLIVFLVGVQKLLIDSLVETTWLWTLKNPCPFCPSARLRSTLFPEFWYQ